MPAQSVDSGNMSLWEHLDALRGVLIKCVALLSLLTVALFCIMPHIFDRFILWPCRGDFPLYTWLSSMPEIPGITPEISAALHNPIQLVNYKLAAPFMIHASTSFWLGLILSFPAIIGLLYGFLKPALHPHERRYARICTGGCCVMFYIGLAVTYLLIFPLTLRFLADYHVSADVPNVISLESYMHTLLTLSLCMGLMFELPVATWLLGKTGLLTKSFFNRYRRHAVIMLMVLAAIITPTSDPFTLMVVFIPIYGLWELGALTVPSAKTTKQAINYDNDSQTAP